MYILENVPDFELWVYRPFVAPALFSSCTHVYTSSWLPTCIFQGTDGQVQRSLIGCQRSMMLEGLLEELLEELYQ